MSGLLWAVIRWIGSENLWLFFSANHLVSEVKTYN
jgi:hypothetical protein